jgi:2-methylaconitate cis-trans-isomerase PrpF
MQTRIPCVCAAALRAARSSASDLPGDTAMRDAVLLAVMGSPHEIQVDGTALGDEQGGDHHVENLEADDYLFAQVQIKEKIVDTKPNCGNMLVAVGPFAIEAGLVAAKNGETTVRIFNVNTGSLVGPSKTPGGTVTYAGEAAIEVGGTAAPVKSTSKARSAPLPASSTTGKPLDVIDGVEVSCVDAAMPVVLMLAEAFGKTGYETAVELDADKALFKRMEAIRCKAGALMGMGDVSKLVVPKIGLLAKPRKGGTITSRFFVPDARPQGAPCDRHGVHRLSLRHSRHFASRLVKLPPAPQGIIQIEHDRN